MGWGWKTPTAVLLRVCVLTLLLLLFEGAALGTLFTGGTARRHTPHAAVGVWDTTAHITTIVRFHQLQDVHCALSLLLLRINKRTSSRHHLCFSVIVCLY